MNAKFKHVLQWFIYFWSEKACFCQSESHSLFDLIGCLMKISGDSVHPQPKIICLCHPVQFITPWDTKYIWRHFIAYYKTKVSFRPNMLCLIDYTFWCEEIMPKNVYWSILLIEFISESLIDIPVHNTRWRKGENWTTS